MKNRKITQIINIRGEREDIAKVIRKTEKLLNKYEEKLPNI